MPAGSLSSQRQAAARLIALAIPTAFAVALAGGGLALLPPLLLLLPILAVGHAPGIERLARLRSRAAGKHRPTSDRAPAGFARVPFARRASILIAQSLAERGPPARVAPNS